MYPLLLHLSLHCSDVILGIHKIKFFLVILVLNPDGNNFAAPKLRNTLDTTYLIVRRAKADDVSKTKL